MAQGLAQAIAVGQPAGAGMDSGCQVAAGVACQAIGFLILQRAGVFLAQAHGFGEPELLQGRQVCHAVVRCSNVR